MNFLLECEMRSHTWSALKDKKLAQVRWSKKIRIILDIFIHYCVVSGQIELIHNINPLV